MPSFEEEAFARAQQMHRRQSGSRAAPERYESEEHRREHSGHHHEERHNSECPQEEQREERSEHYCEERHSEEPKTHKSESFENSPKSNLFETLLKDKDRSLIVLLLVLLMDESTEPSLLLALIYLLM